MSKSSDLQEYLNEFIQDIKAVVQKAMRYNGVRFRVADPVALASAPAPVLLQLCTHRDVK